MIFRVQQSICTKCTSKLVGRLFMRKTTKFCPIRAAARYLHNRMRKYNDVQSTVAFSRLENIKRNKI